MSLGPSFGDFCTIWHAVCFLQQYFISLFPVLSETVLPFCSLLFLLISHSNFFFLDASTEHRVT